MTVGRGELKDSSASNSSMKTTVPNKEKETNKTNMNHNNGMNNSKQPSGAGTSPTSTNGGVNGSGNSKDQMSKGSLEKELEEVNKKLGNLSLSKGKKSSAAGGGGDSQHVESEIKLLERKLLLMLKLKNWKDVRDEGYKILGRKGPNPIIYKCVLVSLCRIGTKVNNFSEFWIYFVVVLYDNKICSLLKEDSAIISYFLSHVSLNFLMLVNLYVDRSRMIFWSYWINGTMQLPSVVKCKKQRVK
jgi:hypothetical protein